MRLRTGTLSNDAFFKALGTKLYSLNAGQGLTINLSTIIAGSKRNFGDALRRYCSNTVRIVTRLGTRQVSADGIGVGFRNHCLHTRLRSEECCASVVLKSIDSMFAVADRSALLHLNDRGRRWLIGTHVGVRPKERTRGRR